MLPSTPLGYRYVTAYLHVDYVSPGPLNDSRYVLLCDIDRIEKDKKVYVKGMLVDAGSGKVVAEGEALFIALQSVDGTKRNELQTVIDCIESDMGDTAKICKLPTPSTP